jgi:hypothetical protein
VALPNLSIGDARNQIDRSVLFERETGFETVTGRTTKRQNSYIRDRKSAVTAALSHESRRIVNARDSVVADVAECAETVPVPARVEPLSSVAPSPGPAPDPLDLALADALRAATLAGAWEAVAELARAVAARRP